MQVGDLVKNIKLMPEYVEYGIILSVFPMRQDRRSPDDLFFVQWNGANASRGDYCYKSHIERWDLEIVSKSLNKK